MVKIHQSSKIIYVIIGFVLIIFGYHFIYDSDYRTKLECTRLYAPLPVISVREEFVQIIHKEGFKTGAEVGVLQGAFSEHLLSHWPDCIEFHAVDLWKHQMNYFDTSNVNDEGQENNYQITRQRLKQWENIIHYHRNYSNIAVHQIKDDSLDFIYIDSRHDYTSVYEDMELYWPKLKCGGVFAGHDFIDADKVTDQDWTVDSKGVRRKDGKAVKGAVIDFAAKHKRHILQTTNEPYPSWYFRKEKSY